MCHTVVARDRTAMAEDYLSSEQAARRLGISRATFYTWLAQSNCGHFVLNGHATEIVYIQGGPRGRGRIRIADTELERLMALMRVSPCRRPARAWPAQKSFPEITVRLGRPPG